MWVIADMDYGWCSLFGGIFRLLVLVCGVVAVVEMGVEHVGSSFRDV